jgi:hypothetical protein
MGSTPIVSVNGLGDKGESKDRFSGGVCHVLCDIEIRR